MLTDLSPILSVLHFCLMPGHYNMDHSLGDHHLPKLRCTPRAPGDHALGDPHTPGSLAKLVRMTLAPS